MKRRTKQQRQRAQKHEHRRAENFKSKGNSRYALKVKSGQQMYGPMPRIPKYPDFRPGQRLVRPPTQTRRNTETICMLEEHGLEWELQDGAVIALIPWVHKDTGERGIRREPVHNARECAVLLGY